MKQAASPAFLEGIALPSFAARVATAMTDDVRRPILFDAAEVAAAAAVAAARQKRGVK
jgi:hypothetical protein